MKDLEIRGAGNLLGGEQSGHIEGVGFDLYVRLVGEAVAEFRQNNDPIEPFNRGSYAVHQAIDRYALAPVARGYRAVVPAPVRSSRSW